MAESTGRHQQFFLALPWPVSGRRLLFLFRWPSRQRDQLSVCLAVYLAAVTVLVRTLPGFVNVVAQLVVAGSAIAANLFLLSRAASSHPR
jgi:hypothetical protein